MKTLKLIGFVVLVELLGAMGSIFTAPKIGTWYANLIKPSFSPPNWLFGPVWITLFALMGIALYIVWEADKTQTRKTALRAFWIQMILNICWSLLFFGLESPLLGFVGIIFLLLAILWTIRNFWKVKELASWLLIPYILWVSFAAILNLAIWILN